MAYTDIPPAFSFCPCTCAAWNIPEEMAGAPIRHLEHVGPQGRLASLIVLVCQEADEGGNRRAAVNGKSMESNRLQPRTLDQPPIVVEKYQRHQQCIFSATHNNDPAAARLVCIGRPTRPLSIKHHGLPSIWQYTMQ